MPDEFVGLGRKMYVVRFSPHGEEFLVEASNAVGAQTIGLGMAAVNEIRHTGIDSYPATEDDIGRIKKIAPREEE